MAKKPETKEAGAKEKDAAKKDAPKGKESAPKGKDSAGGKDAGGAKEGAPKAKETGGKDAGQKPKDAGGKEAGKGKEAAPKRKEKAGPAEPARLQTYYRSNVVADLMKQFGYKTVMQVPRLKKIVVNMGVGEAVNDKKILDNAVGDMTKIAGQKPVVTKARKSIAGYKIRKGYPIGCMVTLRSHRMYEFLDRLITVAIPRIRDFRGISPRSFDGRGNFNMGVKEQIIFPEIEYDKIDTLRGLNITITTTAKTDAEARALLSAFRFPFRT
jgi:large subunit ribosomal protein L5